MFTKQKIKNLIVIFSVMFVLTLTCVFHAVIHPFFINLFADNFNVVSNKDNLLVHFVSVGQGDATAINLPDGKIMLIDTGNMDINTTYLNYIKENVIHAKRKDFIDYLVLSHADMDHIGGTMKLLKTFKIGTVFMPKVISTSQGYAQISDYVKNNCNYTALGEEFKLKTDSYEITFFEILNETNTNDSSQVIKIESKNKSFLFTGDISSSAEELYVERYGSKLDVDVLKVSHHGSDNSTSEDFLNVVTPKHAVISVGFGNDYGHPTYDVLKRLNDIGATILRTDEIGNILLVVGNNYDLRIMDGIYYITSLTLDYVNLIIISDGLLLILVVYVILKKEKNKHNRK